MDRIVEAFTNGKEIQNGLKYKFTKSALEEKLIEAKATLSEIKNGSTEYDVSAQDVEEHIAMLEESIASAPETDDMPKIVSSSSYSNYGKFEGTFDMNKEQPAMLQITQNDFIFNDGSPSIYWGNTDATVPKWGKDD